MTTTAKVSSKNRVVPQKFCDVCRHTVYDLEKHYQTEEHRRNLRLNGNVSLPAEVVMEASKLTPRQLEVLRLVMVGKGTVEVASTLRISKQTVKNHLTFIRCRLKARNTTHAVVIALREGYISLSGEG